MGRGPTPPFLTQKWVASVMLNGPEFRGLVKKRPQGVIIINLTNEEA
jgi:hypothetical protein